jgi:hypothetical protein
VKEINVWYPVSMNMSFEQKPASFNNEEFINEFKLMLSKYLEDVEEETDHPDFQEEVGYADSHYEEQIAKLISFCIKALKANSNKKEILDLISMAYLELSLSSDKTLEPQYRREKEFFKKLIVELLEK